MVVCGGVRNDYGKIAVGWTTARQLQSQAWLTTGKCMYRKELAVTHAELQTLPLIAGKLSDV